MSEPRPRSSSSAILLVIALRGPSSPYDLKRALARLASYFWAVPHTQVYGETARLAEEGLLSVVTSSSGRRRQTYDLTPAGRTRLQAWLRDSEASGMEIRDEAQLKLLGTELSDREAVRALAAGQVAYYQRRLGSVDAADDEASRHPEWAYRFLAVTLGRATLRAGLEFWQAIEADPPGPEPIRSAGRRRQSDE